MSIYPSSFTGDLISEHYCTILVGPSSNLYASTLEGIVVKRDHTGGVQKLIEGWQVGLTVHRLKMYDQTLYACTNQGLFLYQNDAWSSTSIKVSCYQVKNIRVMDLQRLEMAYGQDRVRNGNGKR